MTLQHSLLISFSDKNRSPRSCAWQIRAILSFIVSWGGLPDLSGAMSAAIAAGSSSPSPPTEPTPVKGKKRGRKKGATAVEDGSSPSECRMFMQATPLSNPTR